MISLRGGRPALPKRGGQKASFSVGETFPPVDESFPWLASLVLFRTSQRESYENRFETQRDILDKNSSQHEAPLVVKEKGKDKKPSQAGKGREIF